eukprot:TRINITY_DN33978_c0_g1_i1.p1 TRINITY_DN33978_c0_g1~~TRINITY_DN33978_c0_g1_i1.p1  ORF type:complete len:482 (+),score=77.26 TRINITY_DN33978_c0_g1_i1:168-1613(+)
MEFELDREYTKAEQRYNEGDCKGCIEICEASLLNAKGWGRLQFLILLGKVFNDSENFSQGLELSNEAVSYVMKGQPHPQAVMNRIISQCGLNLSFNTSELKYLQVHPACLIEVLLVIGRCQDAPNPSIDTVLNTISLDSNNKQALRAIFERDPLSIFSIKPKSLNPLLCPLLCELVIPSLFEGKQSKRIILHLIRICPEEYFQHNTAHVTSLKMELLADGEVDVVKKLVAVKAEQTVDLLAIALVENDRVGIRKWIENNREITLCHDICVFGKLVARMGLEDKLVAMTSGCDDLKRLLLLQSVARNEKTDLRVISTSVLNIFQRATTTLSNELARWWMNRLYPSQDSELHLIAYRIGVLCNYNDNDLRSACLLKAAASRNPAALSALSSATVSVDSIGIQNTILGTPIPEPWSLLYVGLTDSKSLNKCLQMAIASECYETALKLLRWYVDQNGVSDGLFFLEKIPTKMRILSDYEYLRAVI